MMLSGIVACVFDAYGTLFDLDKIASVARDALGDREKPLSQLWRAKQLEYSWLRSLMGRHADFWHVTGESLDYALASLGIDDPSLRAKLMEAYLSPPAFDDVTSTLKSLRTAEFKLTILSNGSPTMLTSAIKGANLNDLLDKPLSVETVGVFKPHPSVYRLATDAFDCQPTQIAFISSNGWDIAGASAFGFQTVWVNRRKAPREILPAGPHNEITTLAELTGLLQR
ncbi:MAG TPA: haloacid dehalogenase type II [Magnetospirillaceae bacterium]|jgi:2-haloacid dehalogenase